MIEQTGEDYGLKATCCPMFVGEAKQGKTFFLVAQALGLFPGQQLGGVVTAPRDLVVVAIDTASVEGVRELLTKLGASKEALGFRVFNFEKDAAELTTSQLSHNHSAMFLPLMDVAKRLQDEYANSPKSAVVITASLTGIGRAVERAMMGSPVGSGKGGKGYADQDRWALFGQQMFELQSAFHATGMHVFWEAHLVKKGSEQQGQKDTIAVSGSAGKNWAVNVSHVFRIRRLLDKCPGTVVDKVLLETRPTFDFVSGGRGVTTSLNEQETDLTSAFRRLSKRVGHWGYKKPQAQQTKEQ